MRIAKHRLPRNRPQHDATALDDVIALRLVIALLENPAAVAAQVGPSTYVQSHGVPLAIVSMASVRNSHGYAYHMTATPYYGQFTTA